MTRTLKAGLMALGLLLLVQGTGSAAPISVTMYDYDATHGGNPDLYAAAPGGGGAFWAVTNDPTLGSLLTFCLEVNEHIAYGGSYLVDGVQSAAVNGGAGGAVNGADPVSDASRWLYLMVSTGLYSTATYSSAFDFNGASAGLGSVGSMVQMAIWAIEGETVGSYSLSNLLGGNASAIAAVNALVSAANTAVSSGLWATLQTAYNANIGALNLYTPGGAQMQSQLGGTWRVPPPPPPVPEPASLVLLGSGLLGVACWRRRSRRA